MKTPNKKLLAEALRTIEELSDKLTAVKNRLPIDHHIQPIASYDVAAVCRRLERALGI